MHLICNVEHKSQINQIIQLELKSGFNLSIKSTGIVTIQ